MHSPTEQGSKAFLSSGTKINKPLIKAFILTIFISNLFFYFFIKILDKPPTLVSSQEALVKLDVVSKIPLLSGTKGVLVSPEKDHKWGPVEVVEVEENSEQFGKEATIKVSLLVPKAFKKSLSSLMHPFFFLLPPEVEITQKRKIQTPRYSRPRRNHEIRY